MKMAPLVSITHERLELEKTSRGVVGLGGVRGGFSEKETRGLWSGELEFGKKGERRAFSANEHLNIFFSSMNIYVNEMYFGLFFLFYFFFIVEDPFFPMN